MENCFHDLQNILSEGDSKDIDWEDLFTKLQIFQNIIEDNTSI